MAKESPQVRTVGGRVVRVVWLSIDHLLTDTSRYQLTNFIQDWYRLIDWFSDHRFRSSGYPGRHVFENRWNLPTDNNHPVRTTNYLACIVAKCFLDLCSIVADHIIINSVDTWEKFSKHNGKENTHSEVGFLSKAHNPENEILTKAKEKHGNIIHRKIQANSNAKSIFT